MSALTLDDAKTHLGITNDTSDIELQDTIDAAEAAIGKRVGPLTPTTVTSRALVVGLLLTLPVTPVISLTSAVGVGLYASTSLNVSGLSFDPASGVVGATSVSNMMRSASYDVTYVAGWSAVPGDLLYAVKEMTRHLWRTQRGSGGRPGAAGVDQQQTPGYLIPYAVAELLEPYMAAGFA